MLFVWSKTVLMNSGFTKKDLDPQSWHVQHCERTRKYIFVVDAKLVFFLLKTNDRL